MKTLSEKQALLKLRVLKEDFRRRIVENYEHRAKNCLTCETQGVCCIDAHFVNVHVTRLEAVLIGRELQKLPAEKQKEIEARIEETIETYELSAEGDTFARTFACPLFEKGTGCLVHAVKPLPCIEHACYDRAADLPPDELRAAAETRIEKLEAQTYRRMPRWLPLPVFLRLTEKD
jgi:hypothetical protein